MTQSSPAMMNGGTLTSFRMRAETLPGEMARRERMMMVVMAEAGSGRGP